MTFRPASRQHFKENVLQFIRLHNSAFQTVWGEAEIREDEALALLMCSRMALHPALFQFALNAHKPIGFVLCMPNLPEVLAPLHKPLTSFTGIQRILRQRRAISSVGLLSLAVNPDYQSMGIGTALVVRACANADKMGFQRLEYALVTADNQPSCATAKRFGGQQCRSFGVYQKQLTNKAIAV